MINRYTHDMKEKNYLVINDLGGSDLCWTLVDDVRWAQIQEINNMEEYSTVVDFVGALTCDDEGLDWPEGCPQPKGKLLKQWFTQNGCIEEVHLNNVFGILTLGG